MNSSLTSFLYEYFVAPLLIGTFNLLGLIGNRKIRAGLEMRRRENGTAPWERGAKGTKPIWIHCASGEFEYAKPVINAIKELAPTQKVLVTYFSPSVKPAVERFPGIDFHTPAPLERKKDIQSLIDYHNPAALLIARTDTWPLMLQTAKGNGIPTLLFSATISDSAGRLKPAMREFTKWIFGFLDQIFCVTDEDRAVFTELGFNAVTKVAGDTRYDQVIARLENPKPIEPVFASGIAREQILVAGSTWDEDEVHLLPVIDALKDELRFIIAPHEPTEAHLKALEKKLSSLKASFVRYSHLDSPTTAQVVLVDQVGLLAELYQLGAFAFVGGSFRKTVHSVMEPLSAGCFTFIGPRHLNNREAIEFKRLKIPDERALTCVIIVDNGGDWLLKLSSLKHTLRLSDRDFIRRQIKDRSGRSGLVAKWAINAVVRSQLRR